MGPEKNMHGSDETAFAVSRFTGNHVEHPIPLVVSVANFSIISNSLWALDTKLDTVYKSHLSRDHTLNLK